MISVVIPTLNEADNISATISHTFQQSFQPDEIEIIVVDAGSSDGTLESIKDSKALTFCKPEYALKKYQSLNYGWKKSSGEVVLFLDADTLLPKHFDASISLALKDDKVVGGAFEFSFRKPDWKLSLLAFGNRMRYRFGKIYYGDQAIFARRSILDEIGGVPEEALMEAAFLCKELRKLGKLVLIKPGITTSPRRFQEHGFFKVVWFDLNMFIRFNLGLPVSSYANKYWGKNLKI
ncbi:glycosyltransferase [Ekhidna sp. To15]|uniref:glycosyltransferase n=1 Tax=Ekhidna sp. To15 TaxID=3395267 RepID=UPI003F51D1B9